MSVLNSGRLLKSWVRRVTGALLVFTGFLGGFGAAVQAQTPAQIKAVEDFFTAVQRDNSGAVLGFFLRDFAPNVRSEKGEVPLNVALRAQSYKALDALLAHPKIDVNFLSAAGESPLMLAVIRAEEAWAAKLIARDADVNKTGWTPLHYAASAPNMSAAHLRLAKLLIDKYAYIDAEAPSGNTPLMMAAMFGTEEMVKLLLDEGADPTLKNNDGANAVNLALYAKRDGLAESLHKAHAAWSAKAAAKVATKPVEATPAYQSTSATTTTTTIAPSPAVPVPSGAVSAVPKIPTATVIQPRPLFVLVPAPNTAPVPRPPLPVNAAPVVPTTLAPAPTPTAVPNPAVRPVPSF